MKKLLKLVVVEMTGVPDIVMLGLDDYRPDVEQVNPMKEKFALMKQQLEDKGMKGMGDFMEVMAGIGEAFPMDGGPSHGGHHHQTAMFFVSLRDYHTMGKPTVGDLISADFTISKAEEKK